MGPNGSGKSTLAAVLAGRDGYDIQSGEVLFDGKDLLDLDPEERVDHAMLANTVESRLFELREIRSHEWDPLRHNPGPLLQALLGRDFAPLADRLTALAALVPVWCAGCGVLRTGYGHIERLTFTALTSRASCSM